MATKKSNKSRSKSKRGASGAPRSYSQLYKDDNVVAKESPTTGETAAPAQSSAKTDWGNEYGYVMRDLRALAVVSVVVIALMIGVGFLL